MKIKFFIILSLGLLFLVGGRSTVFAMEHTQMDGLFSMDIPQEWHWAEDANQVVVSYPDGKTLAIDIQFLPSDTLSQADIKAMLKKSNDKMITQGIEAHHATLIDNKEIALDGVYATQLDFKTAPPNPVLVTYISSLNKGYAYTITYGTQDDKMHAVMDDVIATFKFK